MCLLCPKQLLLSFRKPRAVFMIKGLDINKLLSSAHMQHRTKPSWQQTKPTFKLISQPPDSSRPEPPLGGPSLPGTSTNHQHTCIIIPIHARVLYPSLRVVIVLKLMYLIRFYFRSSVLFPLAFTCTCTSLFERLHHGCFIYRSSWKAKQEQVVGSNGLSPQQEARDPGRTL